MFHAMDWKRLSRCRESQMYHEHILNYIIKPVHCLAYEMRLLQSSLTSHLCCGVQPPGVSLHGKSRLEKRLGKTPVPHLEPPTRRPSAYFHTPTHQRLQCPTLLPTSTIWALTIAKSALRVQNRKHGSIAVWFGVMPFTMKSPRGVLNEPSVKTQVARWRIGV
jgi:hypothetical protein